MIRLDLRRRVQLTVLGLLLPSALLAAWAMGHRQAGRMEEELLHSARALTAAYASACEDLLALGAEDGLGRLLGNLETSGSSVLEVQLLDAGGRLLAGSPGGEAAAAPPDLPEELRTHIQDSGGERRLVLEAPVRISGVPMALLRVVEDLPTTGDLFRRALLPVLAVLAVLLGAGFLASHLLVRSVVRPLKDLDQGIQGLRRGDMASRVTTQRGDEIGALQKGFNLMAAELQGTYAVLEAQSAQLERQVEERTEELRQKEALLRQMARNAPLGMLVLGEGRVLFVNEAAAALLDAPGPEALHEASSVTILRRLAARVSSPAEAFGVLRRLSRGEAEAADLRLRDGRTLQLQGAPVRTREGRAVGTLALAQDVSLERAREKELRRAREAAEALAEAKSRFLANMSHEIRTPMNGVLGMTELLLETSLDAEQRDYAETVRRSGEALLTILNDILDFSKIEAGKIELEEIGFCLRDELEDVVVLLMPRAVEKRLELALALDPEAPVHVQGDPVRLRQILTNFVSNAIKFTEKGEVVVRARCLERRDGRAALRFEVQDTGIGIPEEARSRLFQSFSQADVSTTRKFGGTGLGLAISRSLVELMGGRIGVDSTPGEGSTFWFEVSLPEVEGPDHSQAVLEDLQGLEVLVVDDNATNRQILEIHLRHWGLQPRPAAGVEEALAQARAHPGCRLVLTDYEMPGGNGLDLCRRFVEEGLLSGAPRILLTSSAQPLDGEELQRLGIRRTLFKPVRQMALREAMAGVLGGEETGGSAVPQAAAAPAAAALAGRLLVAEDNPVNQKLARRLLERLGFEVEIAGHGRQAVERAREGGWTAILMDCQMPEMDGYEATREIRRMPAGRSIPIIAMTANALQGDREKCLAAGMDDYLTKPIRRDALLEVLGKWARAA